MGGLGRENVFLASGVGEGGCDCTRQCTFPPEGETEVNKMSGSLTVNNDVLCSPPVIPGEPLPKFPEYIGGDKICECRVWSNDCSICEVDCKSDCNYLSSHRGRCFSELACQHDILLELDCEP